MSQVFAINNIEFKRPSSFQKDRYNVTDMSRLANAYMVGDLIAKKRKFYFTYDAITSTEWKNILSLIWDTTDLFFTLTYPEDGATKYCEVYVGDIPAYLHKAPSSGEWVWKNVEFNLIER